MSNRSFQKASELPPQVKQALEALLGRSIQADECVSVRIYKPKSAPQGDDREAAYRTLLDRVDRTAERVKNIPDAEVDAAIDEAAGFVRRNPE